MNQKLILVIAVLISVLAPSIASAEALVWTSGQLGGGWYGDATGMSKIIHDEYPDLSIKVIPGGGVANPLLIAQNKAQLGLGLDIFLKAAFEGKPPYHKPQKNLRMLGMSFSDIYLHFLAANNAPYHSIKKLFRKGKNINIAVTKAGSSDERTFRYVMKYYDTSYEKLRAKGWHIHFLSYSGSASQFSNGQVNYAFHALGLPSSAIIRMAQARSSKLMSWPKSLVKALHKKYGYKVAQIPAKTYKNAQNGSIRTVEMGTVIAVTTQMADKTAYKITKALCDHQNELSSIHASMSVFNCKTAGSKKPIPLATGAKRYYKKQGYSH